MVITEETPNEAGTGPGQRGREDVDHGEGQEEVVLLGVGEVMGEEEPGKLRKTGRGVDKTEAKENVVIVTEPSRGFLGAEWDDAGRIGW